MEGLPPDIDLWQIPYQQPPPGLTSDFTKRSELLVPVITVISIFIFIQVVFLGLRIFTKFNHRDECWKLDDWCVLITIILCSTLGAAIMVGVQTAGRHTWDASIGTLTTAWIQRVLLLQHIFVGISLYMGKCCLLSMYYRLFGDVGRVRYQIYFALFLGIPLLFSSIYQPIVSGPPSGKPWGTPNPKNTLATKSSLVVGIDSLLVDILILYIPIPIVSKLNISRRRKVGVFAIFLTGLIAIIADIVILYFRVQLFRGVDALRYGIIVGTCCVIEIAISVVCSSMPVAAKFARLYIGPSSLYNSLRSRFTSKTSGSGSTPPSLGPSPTRRRRDPYSLALPSTNLSGTRLSHHHEQQTSQVPGDFPPLEPVVYSKKINAHIGEIQRTVSEGSSSTQYDEKARSKRVQDMV